MDKMNSVQRRKHARLLLALPMRVQWVNDEGRIFNEICRSVNISTGGVYYKSREYLPIGTDTNVILDLPLNNNVSDFGILSTRGRVVRVEEIEMRDKGIALRFLEELKFSTSYEG